jgi:hypothetical protein
LCNNSAELSLDRSACDKFTVVAAALQTQSITSEMQSVYDAIAACDTSESAPVVLFVSKMVPVKRGDIVDANGMCLLRTQYPSLEMNPFKFAIVMCTSANYNCTLSKAC